MEKIKKACEHLFLPSVLLNLIPTAAATDKVFHSPASDLAGEDPQEMQCSQQESARAGAPSAPDTSSLGRGGAWGAPGLTSPVFITVLYRRSGKNFLFMH